MKVLSALLFGASILLGHVAANAAALGFELVQFYYVYKMEFQSGIPADERRLGSICTKAKKGMCLFDAFVYSILQDGDLKTYWKANGSGYRTENPGNTEAAAISSRAAPNERINASALSTTFPHNSDKIPYANVVQDVTSVAEKAAAAGGISKADVDNSVSYAKQANVIRETTSYTYVLAHMQTAMGGGFQYLVHSDTDKTFSWKATLGQLNYALKKNQITDAKYKQYKNSIRNASHGILTNADPLDATHWAAAKSFSTFVSKGSTISANLAAAPSTATEPIEGGGPSCPSEFKPAVGAAKRRRQFLEPAMGLTGSSFQLGPHLSFDNGAMDVNVVPVY